MNIALTYFEKNVFKNEYEETIKKCINIVKKTIH